jgi:hypothetical protein
MPEHHALKLLLRADTKPSAVVLEAFANFLVEFWSSRSDKAVPGSRALQLSAFMSEVSRRCCLFVEPRVVESALPRSCLIQKPFPHGDVPSLGIISATSICCNGWKRVSHVTDGKPAPMCGGKKVHLGDLFFHVHRLGGFVSVISSKAWSRVRDELCIDRKVSNAPAHLRKLYEQWLLPVEATCAYC